MVQPQEVGFFWQHVGCKNTLPAEPSTPMKCRLKPLSRDTLYSPAARGTMDIAISVPVKTPVKYCYSAWQLR